MGIKGKGNRWCKEDMSILLLLWHTLRLQRTNKGTLHEAKQSPKIYPLNVTFHIDESNFELRLPTMYLVK